MRPEIDLRAYLVLDPDLCGSVDGMVDTARAAAIGGVTAVQLRHKTATTPEMVEIGQALRSALPAHVPLIVNDDVEAARILGAEGLHIGQDDTGVPEARAAIGPLMALGLSIQTVEQLARAEKQDVDHYGVGPVFATPTKGDHAEPIGWEGLEAVCNATERPCVAIGGLKADHGRLALGAGAQGLAVVSAICGQPDPEGAARALVEGLT